jgi:hypothetical protein
MKDKDSNLSVSFSLFNKSPSISKKKVQAQDDHTFTWSATVEMLSLLMDINEPSLARLCHHSRHEQFYDVPIFDILP